MSEEPEAEAQSSGLGFDPPPGSFGGPLHFDLVVDHVLNIAKYRGAVFVAFGALALLMLGLICLAFQLKDESFGQELSIVFAAGIATFLGTPLIVKLSSKRRRHVIPIVVLLALGCGFWAFFAEGALRALLVEGGVSLLLIVALEILFHRFLESFRETYRSAEEKRQEELDAWTQRFQDKVDEWNREHGLEITGHGFGSIDDYEKDQ